MTLLALPCPRRWDKRNARGGRAIPTGPDVYHLLDVLLISDDTLWRYITETEVATA